jgi:branched-chain amino acid transport system ATP-binding protein
LAPPDPGQSLQVTDVWVHYDGAEAVRGVSLEVKPGEVVALLGANGAGKSTMLRTISGLHRATSGTLRYGDLDLARLQPHEIVRQGIAHVLEGRRLFTRMTVRENLELGLYQTWSDHKPDITRAFELFPDLEPFIDRRCYMLSGGQQQMVAVARVLLPRPRLVLLDEPSLGLAPIIVRRILDVIELMRDQGTSVLLVEQDTSVALDISDRVLIIANGEISAEGLADDERISTELRQAYLGRPAQ